MVSNFQEESLLLGEVSSVVFPSFCLMCLFFLSKLKLEVL